MNELKGDLITEERRRKKERKKKQTTKIKGEDGNRRYIYNKNLKIDPHMSCRKFHLYPIPFDNFFFCSFSLCIFGFLFKLVRPT